VTPVLIHPMLIVVALLGGTLLGLKVADFCDWLDKK
jgi:hypothetical protein